MGYILALIFGGVLGAVILGGILFRWFDRVKKRESAAEARQQELDQRTLTIAKSLEDQQRREKALLALTAQKNTELQAKQKEFENLMAMRAEDMATDRRLIDAREESMLADLGRQQRQLQIAEHEHRKKVIAYEELLTENATLKRDLQNIDVNLHKLQMDGELRDQRMKEIDGRSSELAKRYLEENIETITNRLGAGNYAASKQSLLDVITRVREIGYTVTEEDEAHLLAELRAEYEKEVRLAFEREEQARIKAQIREEEQLKREIEREMKQLERERAAIKAALDSALALAHGEHNAEVQRLEARLAEAEAKSQRAMSMAQQTKAGHVYVISNIGTLGPNVFKVGMTRRLKPEERVVELGDASVPFPFDVHMMISCTDAPTLENALHRALHKNRLNKVNLRKEFFRSSIDEIVEIVKKHHGTVEYKADPEAIEYRQSITMSEEDAEYIESTFEEAEQELEHK